MRVAWSPGMPRDATLLRVQAETCAVLNIALGPLTVDLLGVLVAISPVSLDLAGVVGTPLGDLVCGLLENVSGLVNTLNGILGLLTGLLGGLTGGLGGIVP